MPLCSYITAQGAASKNIEELIEEGACMNNALKGLMAAIARTSSN